jgi:hypothetical protein
MKLKRKKIFNHKKELKHKIVILKIRIKFEKKKTKHVSLVEEDGSAKSNDTAENKFSLQENTVCAVKT